MTALANQVCDGKNYNNFDEMLVHMNKESTEQGTKRNKQAPVDTDSHTDEEKTIRPPGRKKTKRNIFFEDNQLSDEDYDDVIQLDNDNNSD